jgi:16S rRNA (cytosine1402-N4)-methyltransferase
VHASVLVAEVVSALQPGSQGTYVDATVGYGGHTAALLDAGAGLVIGIDRDPEAIAACRTRFADRGPRVVLVHADFRALARVLADHGQTTVDGVVADLGVSSPQLDEAARGFSFRHDGPLDMRMDPTAGRPLASLLADADERTLADVIFRFGEERHARRIARAMVRARSEAPIVTTGMLASIVRRAVGGPWRRIDPATRTFQALRIWTNDELDGLDAFVTTAVASLSRGGRLAAIAFHSLEDRIVKHTLRSLGAAGTVRVLTKKPVEASEAEIATNPRSRSARLRVAEKTA